MKKALLLSIVILIAILAFPCSCFGLNEAWPLPVKIINVSGSDNGDPVKPLQNLCDGDPSTLWSTTATTPSDTRFEVKLEEPVIVDFIEITGAISGSADDVSVYYADSNDIWQPFLGHKHTKLVNGRIDLSWNRAFTNRLRFVLHNSSQTSVLGNLGEVKVFGHKLEDLVRLSGQVVTSSEDSHYPGKFLNDHNSYTVWKALANTNSASVTIFFPEANSIKRIKFFNHDGSGVISFSAQINGVWTLFGTTVDLTSLPEGWQTFDIPDLLVATAIKLDLTTSGTNQPGGLAEVEVWGKDSVPSKQTLLLAENLTGSTAVGFDLDNTTTWDEAAIWFTLPAGLVNFTPLISVNGNSCKPIITLLPAGNCTLAKIPLPLDQLATGHNIINLNLGPVSADDAVLILSCDNGSLNITSIKSIVCDLPDLFDGNRYTATSVSGDTLEVDLNSTAAVDEIRLFSNSPLTLNYTNISSWQNNSWLPLDPAKLQNDGMVIKINGGTSPTQKIRIQLDPQNIAALTEIEVIGSRVNDGPPVVTITAPTNSNVTTGSYITIEGYVDNAINIAVNGINATVQGHFFSCPVYIRADSGGTFKVTAIATDSQGQIGQAEKSYYINQSTTDPLPIITCSLPEVFYTTNSQLNIQGNVTNASEVKINSVTTNLNSGVYSSSVNLVEGANKVNVEAFSSSGAMVSLERTVILDTQAPVLALSEKIIVSNSLGIIGSCMDISPTELRINGAVVSVTNNNFSCTILLVSGQNNIVISAQDSLGHKSTINFTENISANDSINVPVQSNSTAQSNTNDLDVVALYTVPDMSKYQDKSPYGNCIENSKETVSPSDGSLNVEVSDMVLPGRDGFDLEIKRMYNSNQAQGDAIYEGSDTERSIPVDLFGNGWSLNIPWIETITPVNGKSYKNLRLPDGQNIKISMIQNNEYHEGIHFSFIYSAQDKNYTLTMNDGTVYVFDSSGKVITKTSPSGHNQFNFYYKGKEIDQIVEVDPINSVDLTNRVANFTYQTVGSKRVINTIKVGSRTITYQYYSGNGLLRKVISPWETISDARNRTTEYVYTSPYSLTFGMYFIEERYVTYNVCDDYESYTDPDTHITVTWCAHSHKEGEWETVAEYNFHKNYNLSLLQNIIYPTKGVSTYTYLRNSQYFDKAFSEDGVHYTHWGDKFLVNQQTSSGKATTFNYHLNGFLGTWGTMALPNSYIYWTEVLQGDKKTHYDFAQIAKLGSNASSYYIATLPIYYYDTYVGPLVSNVQILNNNSAIENVTYNYDLPKQAVTLEQHYRGGKDIYDISNQYDTWGNLTSNTDGRTGLQKTVSYYSHDSIKNLPEIVTVKNLNPLTGQSSTVTTIYHYNDTLGKPYNITVNDGNKNLITTFTYYPNGNLWTQTQPSSLITEISYDDLGLFPTKKTLKGLTDVNNRALANIETKYSYNFFGLKNWEMDPRGYVTVYRYDEFNRLIKSFLPEDSDSPFSEPVAGQDPVNHPYREYSFDDQNNTCDFWNENRQKTRYIYDSYGRLTATTAYDDTTGTTKEVTTTYTYDDQGRLASVVDPRGKITSTKDAYTTWYQYDGLGRLSTVIFPSETGDKSVFATLQYDDLNNITTLVQENSNLVIEQKDWAERLIKAIKYCRFEGVNQSYIWNITYDSQGNKIKQVNPKGEYIYCYDALGHLIGTVMPTIPVVLPETTSYTNPFNFCPIVSYQYEDSMGNRTAEISANAGSLGQGANIEYNYDQLGRLVRTTNSFSQLNLSTKQVNNLTANTDNYYDAAGNKIQTKDANGGNWYYTYSARGFLLSEQDPLGNITRYRYDPLGNKIATVDPRNKVNTPVIWYSFDANHKPIIYDPRTDKSYTTWYIYDALNRQTRVVLPDSNPPVNPYATVVNYDNPYTETGYDLAGNKTSAKDANGVFTYYEYNARNWLKLLSDDRGTKEWYEYDPCGHQTYVHTRIKSNIYSVTQKDYDSWGQLRRITFPNQDKEEYQYDFLGNRTSVTDGNSHTTSYTYNDLGWLISVQDPLQNITQYRYDPSGNQVATIAPNNLLTVNCYDQMNHLVEQVDSLNNSSKYEFDLVGNRKRMLDRRSTMWAYDYYANNLLQQLTLTGVDHTTFTINYEYDPAGNRTIVSDTSKIENTILYNEQASDPLNRINSVKREFDGKIYLSEYGYNKNGQLTSSELTEYKYDNVGQLITIAYPDAISKRIYNYDDFNQLNEVQGLTQKAGITYWADGLPQSIALVNGVNTNFSYDDNRRLKDLNISGKNDIIKYNYHYDAAGNIKIIHNGITNQDNSYNYYDNNQLKLAMVPGTFAEKDPTTGTPGLKEQDYLADARFDFTLEPALAVKLDYNASSIGLDFGTIAPKLKKIELIADAACQNLRLSSDALDLYISSDNINYSLIPSSEWTLEMGINGTVITLTKTWSARYLKIHVKCDERDADNVPVDQATFLNDLVNMVKVYQEASSECEEYQYDEAGNRTQLKETLVQSKTNLYSYYRNSNRLKTDGKYLYVYDLNGNLTQKGNTYNNIFGDVFIFTTSGKNVEYWEYKYDLMNRLTEVWTNGTNGITKVAEYGYDPEGLRVVKRAHGETIHYIFEGTEPVFERRINSNQIRSYVYALGKHLARVDGVIGDTAVNVYYYHTDQVGSVKAVTDQQGNVIYYADYMPFGSQYVKDGGFDETHGFTGKEYDSDSGLYYFNARWYDSELGRFISEDPGDDPNNPNLYVYCRNNPVIFDDPTGLISQEDAMWLNNYDLTYNLPNYIMNNIGWNMEKYGFNKAFDFGLGLYSIQLEHNGNLTKYTGWFKNEALPEVAALEKKTGIGYDTWNLSLFELNYKAENLFGTNVAAMDFRSNTERINSTMDVLGFAYSMGLISGQGRLPNNPEGDFRPFNLSKVDVSELNNKPLYRVMSESELDAVKETGYLRGGREGETFFTDSYFKSADTAKSRLSLKNEPEYIVEFKIKNNPDIQGGTRVKPDYGEVGGGREYYTNDPVEVNIINYQKLR